MTVSLLAISIDIGDTGIASDLRVGILDGTGTQRIGASNAPDGRNAIHEINVGSYGLTIATIDVIWFPVTAVWTKASDASWTRTYVYQAAQGFSFTPGPNSGIGLPPRTPNG